MKFATIRPGMLLLLFTSCFAQSDYQAPVTFSPTPEHPVCNEYYLEHDSSLTFKQRACLYKSTVITPSAVFGAAFFAGIDQARNTPAEWRQGFVGYSRRFGSNLGQSVAKTTANFWLLRR